MPTYTNLKDLSAETFAIGAAGSEVVVNPKQFIINGIIKDVTTASINWSGVSPYAGTISSVYSVLTDASIKTDGASVLSFKINLTSASDVTSGGITIAAATAAGAPTIGAVDSSTPTGNNTLAAGQSIAMITDGGGVTLTSDGSTTAPASITFICTRT